MDRGGGVCLCLCLWCRCVSVASHSDRFTQVIHSHIYVNIKIKLYLRRIQASVMRCSPGSADFVPPVCLCVCRLGDGGSA